MRVSYYELCTGRRAEEGKKTVPTGTETVAEGVAIDCDCNCFSCCPSLTAAFHLIKHFYPTAPTRFVLPSALEQLRFCEMCQGLAGSRTCYQGRGQRNLMPHNDPLTLDLCWPSWRATEPRLPQWQVQRLMMMPRCSSWWSCCKDAPCCNCSQLSLARGCSADFCVRSSVMQNVCRASQQKKKTESEARAQKNWQRKETSKQVQSRSLTGGGGLRSCCCHHPHIPHCFSCGGVHSTAATGRRTCRSVCLAAFIARLRINAPCHCCCCCCGCSVCWTIKRSCLYNYKDLQSVLSWLWRAATYVYK